MQWTRNRQDTAISELVDETKGGGPLARLGFVDADRALCELEPKGRLVFRYVENPKSVHVLDGWTDRVLGVMPLSWKDSGTLNLGGEKLAWEYTGIFEKSRQWVDAKGTPLVHMDVVDPAGSSAVRLGAQSQAAPLLVALGRFLLLLLDSTPPFKFVSHGGPFAWGVPAPRLLWTESEHPEAQFELAYEGGEPLAQLTITDETHAAGAVKRFAGAAEEGKWTFELAPPVSGMRRLEVRNAETKAIVATMDVDAAYAGHLLLADTRYAWSSVGSHDHMWSFTGPDGRLILEHGTLSTDAIELPVSLTGEHPRASFLAFVGFFLIAMKYVAEGGTLLTVDLASTGDGEGGGSGSGGSSVNAIDVAGAIFDLLD